MSIRLAVSALLLLPLSSVAALGETGEIRGRAAPVTVYTQFEHQRSEKAFRAMQAEVAAIMGPAGLRFEWRSLDGDHENEVSAELIVVTFKGACEADDAISWSDGLGALGWTHVSDGVVLPFTEIDCDRIRSFLAHQLGRGRPAEREGLLGRALGRVLAHEMYHVLANTVHHGSAGVGKAAYTAAELVSARFRFEEAESHALKLGKVRALIRAAQPQPAAVALTSAR